MKRFRTKKGLPRPALVQARVPLEHREQVAKRAAECGVSFAEYVRTLFEWDLADDNPWPVHRLLTLEAAQAKEQRRRLTESKPAVAGVNASDDAYV